MNVFPQELNLKLRDSLRISKFESTLIDKCNSIIIDKNEKICNVYDSDSNKKLKYVKLNTKEGIYIMFKILLDLREFKKRRPSKQI